MRPKTPQEKKQLSYEKDRRNVYGEAPHAARRTIPLHKRSRNRTNRRMQERQLRPAESAIDLETADDMESRMRARAPKVWTKSPDAPLGEVVKHKLQRRARARNA